MIIGLQGRCHQLNKGLYVTVKVSEPLSTFVGPMGMAWDLLDHGDSVGAASK